jgi:hypothetical protein
MTSGGDESVSNASSQTTVLIIGAGPSGLTLARELQQRGVEFVVLEKGEVGDSWQRMPKSLKLVSPWKCNWLSTSDRNRHGSNDQLTRAEFLDYLRGYATAHGIPVQTNCEVFSVRREADRFHISTSQGDFVSKMVVNATGYFSNPVRPQIEGAATTAIPQLHYGDYQSAEQLRAIAGPNALVLLVGKRLSAGQTMLELVDAGFRVALSHRTPIRFGVDEWLWPFIYRNFVHLEKLKLMLSAGRARALDVRMAGDRAKKLIQSGAVATFPAIACFEENSVVFANDERFAPGIVLYTTGFAPALRHLAGLNLMLCSETGTPLTHQMESTSVPDLFFLGFEMLRNFQSRFLRGIRNDAVELADLIEGRLENSASVPASLSPQRGEGLRVRGENDREVLQVGTTRHIPTPHSGPLPVEGSGRRMPRLVARSLNVSRLLLYYLRVPITWTALTLHNSWGILNVLDIIWLRPMRGGLIGEQHPFCTGIDSTSGEPIWHRNVVFKTPRREHWPNTALAPDSDEEIIHKVGDHLRKQVLMAAQNEKYPTGRAAPMPPGILYIHGSVHFNGVWLLFNDFAEAIRHFSDPKFAAEFRRLVREEKREPVTLFRDRDYDRTEFARFVCFMRTIFPWFSNCNGPKKFVLWGNPSPYPAVNTITGNWIRETRALKTEHGRRMVARPPMTRTYFQSGPYFGERETTRWPENLLAFLTNKRIALRGERENLYFVDKQKIRCGFRFGPEPIPTPARRLQRWWQT